MVCVEVASTAYVLGFQVLHFIYSHPPALLKEQPKGKQKEPFSVFSRMKKIAHWVGTLLAYRRPPSDPLCGRAFSIWPPFGELSGLARKMLDTQANPAAAAPDGLHGDRVPHALREELF